MARLQALVALLLVALWLPAWSHVHGQHRGPPDETHPHLDHADPGVDDPGHPDLCANHPGTTERDCWLSCGKALPAASIRVLNAGCLWADGALPLIPSQGDPQASGLAPPPDGRPDLTCSWQFRLRAALPVRAPSLGS